MAAATKSNLYKFAYQKKKRKPIHVHTIREDDPEQIYYFCRRIAEVESLTHLEFCEIQQIMENGDVAILYGSTANPWPKGVTTVDHRGIMARRAERNGSKMVERMTDLLDSRNPKPLENKEEPKPTAIGLLAKELADSNVAFTLPLKIKVA